ncbi:MAG: DUF938 domain-containing protein [Pseudomonadota bacterium]
MSKPFAPAAEQNREPILDVLKTEFSQAKSVLEIGSGTGQHAVHFATNLPYLTWHCSDKKEMLAGINIWINEFKLANTPLAIELDVCDDWPTQNFDSAYGANIAHIMHSNEIEAMFQGLNKVLNQDAVFCLYGPFNIDGQYTSESNQRFDLWLKEMDPESCIRDKAFLDNLAIASNLKPMNSYQMPSNNLILCWKKF